MNKPILTLCLLLISLSLFGQKQHDLEIGFSRWNVYSPDKFNTAILADNNEMKDNPLFQKNLTGLSSGYQLSQYYFDLTRHEHYGKKKRTELAVGLGFSMTFRDRFIVTSYNEYLTKYTSSGNVTYKSTDKVWVNMYDRYNSIGIGPKLVFRGHINQRLSTNFAINTEFGVPVTNEFLVLVSTVQKDEWTSDDSYSYKETSLSESMTISHKKKWHVAANSRVGMSYKMLESSKFFLELGLNYGVRHFGLGSQIETEWYYSPSVGFRAYL